MPGDGTRGPGCRATIWPVISGRAWTRTAPRRWRWPTPATIDAAGKEVAEVAIRYGSFIQTVIDFLLIALVIFLVLKAYNRVRKPVEAAPAATPEDVLLLREIRDSLKK